MLISYIALISGNGCFPLAAIGLWRAKLVAHPGAFGGISNPADSILRRMPRTPFSDICHPNRYNHPSYKANSLNQEPALDHAQGQT